MEEHLSLAVPIVAVIFTGLGVAGTQFYSRLKNKREKAATDDQISDRIKNLVKEEADARAELLKTGFAYELLEQKLAHAEEIKKLRSDFEGQLRERDVKIEQLQADADRYHCDLAPACELNPARAKTAIGGPY